MKKKSLRIFLLAMGMMLYVASVYSQTFVDQHGQLRVSGNRIVDKNGNPIALRGMSLYWSQWKPAFYNASCIKWLRDDWKCTVVRAAMAVGSDGYLTNPTAEKAKVKAVVQACIDYGIYAIIDWHSLEGNEANVGAAQTFFAEMAQTYGSYPNVLYELWNEPTAVSWSAVVKPYHEAVIGKIRPIDPDNIVICGTDQWDQHPNLAAADPITKYTNIAYSLHFYAATHKQWLRDNAQTALNLGAALFVTEWGTSEATGNGVFDSAETQIWWNFLDQNYIGQCNWSIADLNETSAALFPGASGTGAWTSANLKPSGQLVRDYLIQKNGSGATDPTAAPTEAGTPSPTTGPTAGPVCNPMTIVPYMQINGGTWENVSSVTVSSGATVIFGPQPLSGGTWNWSGCGSSLSTREITLYPTSSCTITATYTNDCGARSTLDFTITCNTTPVTKGDANSNGTIDIVDALLVAQYYVGSNPQNFNAAAADTNCSGGIDIVDALLIARQYVGLISNFPC